MVHHVQVLGHGVHVGGALEVVEGGVEGQAGAHPQEHAGAEAVARGPEVVAAVAGVLQVLSHRLDLLFRLEGGQLQTQRPAVLVGEEVVELGRVRVHPAHEVLDAIELDGGDALAWIWGRGEQGREGVNLAGMARGTCSYAKQLSMVEALCNLSN